MKTTLTACCAVLAAGVITVGAQSPAPQQPTTQQPTQSPQTRPQPDRPQTDRARSGQMGEAGTMTVTGCLKTWDGSMKDSSGTADASSAQQGASATPRYVLTDVSSEGMQQGRSGAGSSASSPARPAAGASSGAASSGDQTLALMSEGGNVDFSKHVNHKVQLTGKLDAKDQTSQGSPQQSSTGTAGSTGTATTGRSAQSMPMSVPTFNVSALKHVSASCSS